MRSALWAVMCVLALGSASCAGGAENDLASAGNGGGTCGDGVVDPAAGEDCEPSVTLPANVTCQALGMGTGMIACGSTCQLMMMCTPPQVPMGGDNAFTGGGGNGS